MSAAAQRVQAELGARLDALARLDEAALDRLAAQLHAAREQQQRELEAAIEQTLTHVPMLLRPALRKIFEAGT